MIFAICAGHSDAEPGAVYGQHREADLMLRLRDKVAAELVKRGHKVLTDGVPKQNLSLREAMTVVKRVDVAVELHTNASANLTAKGVEALSLPALKVRSQKLSSAVATVLKTSVRGDRGWKSQEESARGRLGFVGAGGIILEVFFLSNPAELAAYLKNEDSVAAAIAESLVS